MYSVRNEVGQLVEIRIWSPVSVEEAVGWGVEHDAAIDRVRGPYVCFVDLVDATVFPPDAVDAYVATMRNETRLVRTGTLLPASPTVALQIERMIRESGNRERRAFRNPEQLEGWLAQVLGPDEQLRLRTLCAMRTARPL